MQLRYLLTLLMMTAESFAIVDSAIRISSVSKAGQKCSFSFVLRCLHADDDGRKLQKDRKNKATEILKTVS